MKGRKKREAPFRAEPVEVPADVREALDVGLEISRVIEEEVPERAKAKNAEYFESVEDRSKDICETIGNNNRVSDAQRTALDNMLAGLRKWVRREE